MNTRPAKTTLLALAACVAVLSCGALTARAQTAENAWQYMRDIGKSQSFQDLLAAETDADILLGLAVLVDPAERRPIREKALTLVPSSAPKFLVLEVSNLFSIREPADALVKADPANAYSHAMRAYMLLIESTWPGHTEGVSGGFAELAEAARCPKLDTYQKEIGAAALKAIDALNLSGPERFAALWLAARRVDEVLQNLSAVSYQISFQVSLLSSKATAVERSRAAEDMLSLSGLVIEAVNDRSMSRFVAYGLSKQAFLLKAEAAAAEKSPQEYAYTAAANAVAQFDWGLAGGETVLGLSSALRTSSEAFRFTYRQISDALELQKGMPDAKKADILRLKEDYEKASDSLFDASALSLEPVMALWLTSGDIEAGKLLHKNHQDVIALAGEMFAVAERARLVLASDSLIEQNKKRLKDLGLALVMYMADHDKALPPTLDQLLTDGYLKDPAVLTSVIDGKPYVYLGAGRVVKDEVQSMRMFILYDPAPLPGDTRLATCADAHSIQIPMDLLAQEIEKQKDWAK